MDKRTLLAVVLSIIVLLVYQNFFAKPPVKTAPAPTQQEATVASQAAKPAPAATAAAPAAATIQTATMGRIAAAQAVTGTERDVIVETPLYRAVFTTRGAALKSFQLKQYKTESANSEDICRYLHAPDRPRETETGRRSEAHRTCPCLGGNAPAAFRLLPRFDRQYPRGRVLRGGRQPARHDKGRGIPPSDLYPVVSGRT